MHDIYIPPYIRGTKTQGVMIQSSFYLNSTNVATGPFCPHAMKHQRLSNVSHLSTKLSLAIRIPSLFTLAEVPPFHSKFIPLSLFSSHILQNHSSINNLSLHFRSLPLDWLCSLSPFILPNLSHSQEKEESLITPDPPLATAPLLCQTFRRIKVIPYENTGSRVRPTLVESWLCPWLVWESSLISLNPCPHL